MVQQLCGVGKAAVQGDSQAGMLWHLWQFEARVLTSVHFCDEPIQLSNKGYGNIDHSIALVGVKFT